MSARAEWPISQAAALRQQTSEVLELEVNQSYLFYHAELSHQPVLSQTWFSSFLSTRVYVLSLEENKCYGGSLNINFKKSAVRVDVYSASST